MSRFLTVTYVWARRCAVAIIGSTVVLIGVLMIVLPGPAFIVIPAGLAILGIEFACARRWLRQLRITGSQVFNTTLGRFFRRRTESHSARAQLRTDHAHAAPPFAPGPLALQRPRTVTANTKKGCSRPL